MKICVFLNCLLLFYINLKLKLLTQFPTLNDEKKDIFYIELFYYLDVYYKMIHWSKYLFISFEICLKTCKYESSCNLCTPELFVAIFHEFKAGKTKNILVMKDRRLPNRIFY